MLVSLSQVIYFLKKEDTGFGSPKFHPSSLTTIQTSFAHL